MADPTTHALTPVSATREEHHRAVIASGPDAGEGIAVVGPVLVGTSELCDLRLADRTVSRRHLLLEPHELGVRARDQQSTNGMWLGTCRVFDVELPADSEVRIGSTVLRIERVDVPTTRASVGPRRDSFGRFLGKAPCLERVYDHLERAGPTDAPLLLEGESGTGKELLAEEVHERSPRKDRPFVVIELGALAPGLSESHLFGHVRGAFTGAVSDHAGAFERAHGGTVLLDDISEAPPEVQARLLRALEQQEIRRVGGNETISIDVRIIATTNRNIEREVEDRRFRLDLFHRIAVVLVRVPPLRDRLADLELLVRAFLDASGASPKLATEELLQRLREYPWPGNVRELRSFVERLALFGAESMAPAATSEVDPLRAAVHSGLPFRQARAHVLEAFTQRYVEEMLFRHGGNVSRAAEAAGIARRHFQRLKQT